MINTHKEIEMKKTVAALLVLSTPILAHANGWYVGDEYGRSVLSYDVDKLVNNRITHSGYAPEVAVLAQLGSPINTYEHFSSSTNRIFGGYQFTPMWSLEGGYRDWGTFRANASINGNVSVNESGSISTSSYALRGHTYTVGPYNGTINGQASGAATAEAVGTAHSEFISGLMTPQITQNLRLLVSVGVEHVNAHVQADYNTNYQYSYSGTINGSGSNGKGGGTSNTSEPIEYSAFIPMFGIGTEYSFTKHWAARAQMEHVAEHQTASISFYEAGVVYHF
jgi:hypothetical protein